MSSGHWNENIMPLNMGLIQDLMKYMQQFY